MAMVSVSIARCTMSDLARELGLSKKTLYQHFRSGSFGYQIPLENGRYQVTLGFGGPEWRVEDGAAWLEWPG